MINTSLTAIRLGKHFENKHFEINPGAARKDDPEQGDSVSLRQAPADGGAGRVEVRTIPDRNL